MLGNKIKEIRLCLGLQQKQLAVKLVVSKNSVSNWEKGKTNISRANLEFFISTFNINPQWLYEGKGEMFLDSSNTVSGAEHIIEWIKELSPDRKIWLNFEMPTRFPEYQVWLETKK